MAKRHRSRFLWKSRYESSAIFVRLSPESPAISLWGNQLYLVLYLHRSGQHHRLDQNQPYLFSVMMVWFLRHGKAQSVAKFVVKKIGNDEAPLMVGVEDLNNMDVLE
jgi:hypothetical protein